MAKLINGKEISQQIKDELKEKVSALKAQGKNICLAVIQVGNDPASSVYVGNKKKACAYIGIESRAFELPEETTEEELLSIIKDLNEDDGVHGILVQLPVPKHINEEKIINAISPKKDVDGLKVFPSMSPVIEEYYQAKSVVTRIRQRSTDLRKIVNNAIERTAKKYDLQRSQLKDTEKRDKYKVYGELLTAYGYSCKPGDKEITCENYYDGSMLTISLDPAQSAMENAKRYFNKYNKLKRTYEALMELTVESKEELDYLLSVQNSLEIAKTENDLQEIKQELVESGYVRGRFDRNKQKKQVKAKPLHYISSDGYHMYVGKNNFQNEELTFKFAEGNDLWFHAKQMPGSHVIVKTNGETEIPDRTYEEAARLAAYYSTGKEAPKVEIDYTTKKNLKKPPKAKPGFVIYHTNYSMSIEPDIHGIAEA